MAAPGGYSFEGSSEATATAGNIGAGSFSNIGNFVRGSGIDLPTIVVVGGLALVALMLFKKRGR